MQKPSPIPSFVDQLLALAASCATTVADHQQVKSWPANPFPPGIRTGSTTDKTLQALEKAWPRTLNHGEIMQCCSASRGAVSWAVAYLEAQQKIQSFPDGSRQSNYKRYLFSKPKDKP